SRKNRDLLASFAFLILLVHSSLFCPYIRGFALNKPWVEKVNTVLGPHCKFLGLEIWKELCAEMLNESAAN
ncbi:MAG: hypothetical protein IJC57_01845, partial [Clostridia bacterium]|nr:hypothetical protein [Clostridia bacterium]